MSTWHEACKAVEDIDYNDKEVNFYVCNDDHGAVYLSISFKQIEEIANKIICHKEHDPKI